MTMSILRDANGGWLMLLYFAVLSMTKPNKPMEIVLHSCTSLCMSISSIEHHFSDISAWWNPLGNSARYNQSHHRHSRSHVMTRIE